MKLSGKVYSTTGEPIQLANVVYIRPDGQSTSNGTQTNEHGNWTLDVPTTGSIAFSHIEYVKRTLPVGQLPFVITMDKATYNLPTAEVVTSPSKRNNKWLIYIGLLAIAVLALNKIRK